ncbi:MAG: 50S ribosomal protein L22 [Nanoarchaeota archaeon]
MNTSENTNKIEAIANSRSLPISTKQSVEICNMLRGKTSDRGKKILELVINMKAPVPYKRYMHGVGHRSGKLAAGRYPQKASSYILTVLKCAESNATNKGLTAPFQIKEIIANQAARSWHFGRQRRRKTKSTHLKIVLTEIKQANEKNKSIKTEKTSKPQK